VYIVKSSDNISKLFENPFTISSEVTANSIFQSLILGNTFVVSSSTCQLVGISIDMFSVSVLNNHEVCITSVESQQEYVKNIKKNNVKNFLNII
jgi:hypothetical protein